MKPLFFLFAVAATAAAQTPFDGRWDLTIKTPTESYPSWLEVRTKEGKPDVRLCGRVASVKPAQNVVLDGSHLSFTSVEWFGKNTKVTWDFTAAGGKVTGRQTREGAPPGQIAGDRAPALDRPMPKNWTKPEQLFNGKDLTGWEPVLTEPGKPVQNNYMAMDGELVNMAPGANLRTTRTFQDFKLHVEYNCPKDGNSGVYLRGRYEVQVAYDKNDERHGMGSIYGFIAPKAMPDKPGEWETFDVTLVGRHVTVVRNGVTTIDNQEIPGITGGALDSHEGEPGPIYIQGDHTGGMKYRNLTISVPAP